MKKEWLVTLEYWCDDLAKCENQFGTKGREIESYIVATAMLATGYEWSTEEDRYIKKEV